MAISRNLDTIKAAILRNSFVDSVRIDMRIDDDAYEELCALLRDLAKELKGVRLIDKELALALYSIPLMVRNAFVSFDSHPDPKPSVCLRLEDQWVDLDALVTDCLADD